MAFREHSLMHPLPYNENQLQEAKRTALRILGNFGEIPEVFPGPNVDPWRVGRYEQKYYKYVNWAFQTNFTLQEMEEQKDQLLRKWAAND